MESKQRRKLLVLPLFFLGFFCLIYACNTKEVESVEALQDFVRETDNGLKKQKKIGAIEMSVTYKPTDLLVAQEYSSDENKSIDTLRSKYSRYDYFTLSISADNKEIENYNLNTTFGERVQNLAFGMGENVYLISETQDTLGMVDYIYQRTYGMSNSSDFLFVFDAKEIDNTEAVTFQLNDIGLGIGLNRFKFETENLRNIPTIKFN
jgi:hypothetical protein